MPAPEIVLDASTAILLAKVDLLRAVVESADVWMTAEALEEATVKETSDALLIGKLVDEGRVRKAAAPVGVAALMRDFRLERGEAETILLAQGRGAVVATDDGPAIRACKVLGLPFATAIHFLVQAARAGEVGRERGLELLRKLEKFGRYDARILEDAGRRIREARCPSEETP